MHTVSPRMGKTRTHTVFRLSFLGRMQAGIALKERDAFFCLFTPPSYSIFQALSVFHRPLRGSIHLSMN